jgi:hypothetical protein
MELARQMNAINPSRDQVEALLDIAVQNLPVDDRETFKSEMMDSFDFESLDKVSIKAMADIFTLRELEKMVEYYGSDEARTIAEKRPIYDGIIQPEITKNLDRALMRIRAGQASD